MVWKWIKEGFRRIWRPSEPLASMSFATFLFFMAVISSLLLAGVQMTFLTYFWIASGVWFLITLLSLIRIKMEPDKLNIIIKKLDKLIELHGGNDMANDNKENEEKITITRAEFHALVRKAAQPIKKATESDSASGETSESRHSDDCNEKNTR